MIASDSNREEVGDWGRAVGGSVDNSGRAVADLWSVGDLGEMLDLEEVDELRRVSELMLDACECCHFFVSFLHSSFFLRTNLFFIRGITTIELK